MTGAVNPLRGEASLTVGDGTYLLVFDVNAFCVAEQALDLRTIDIADRIENKTESMTELRGLLWAGLARHHACSVSEAGDIMSRAGVGETRDALIMGLAAAFGMKVERPKADPPKPAEDGTG